MIWGYSLQPDPPSVDPRTKGWDEEKTTKTLRPKMSPKGCKTAPDTVLESTRCNCPSSQCKITSCSCAKLQYACSEFCGCQTNGCFNKWNEPVSETEEGDSNVEYNKPDGN